MGDDRAGRTAAASGKEPNKNPHKLTLALVLAVVAFGVASQAALGASSQATMSSLDIDDVVPHDGNRGRVTGSLTCDAGDVFMLHLQLTQDDARATGRRRGTCTGSVQPFAIHFRAESPALVDGEAEACLTASTAEPSTRDASTTEVCETVTLSSGTGSSTTTTVAPTTSPPPTSTTVPPPRTTTSLMPPPSSTIPDGSTTTTVCPTTTTVSPTTTSSGETTSTTLHPPTTIPHC